MLNTAHHLDTLSTQIVNFPYIGYESKAFRFPCRQLLIKEYKKNEKRGRPISKAVDSVVKSRPVSGSPIAETKQHSQVNSPRCIIGASLHVTKV